jgi:hypothetical protein
MYSAVFGCFGLRKRSSVRLCSTISPRSMNTHSSLAKGNHKCSSVEVTTNLPTALSKNPRISLVLWLSLLVAFQQGNEASPRMAFSRTFGGRVRSNSATNETRSDTCDRSTKNLRPNGERYAYDTLSYRRSRSRPSSSGRRMRVIDRSGRVETQNLTPLSVENTERSASSEP